MSYHNTSTPVTRSTTNTQGQTAPTGYHYMPDGSLMLDSSHVGYQEDKVITSFDLDLSDLPASSSVRSFTFIGDSGAEFILEIKNEDNHYYNFVTSSFQATKANLENAIVGGNYKGAITFPTVTDDDQYDISVYAKPGTKHSPYNEVRFGDGSLDINSSRGSNSLMMQKVVYQYTALTLTINGYSPTGTVSATLTPDTISTSRGKSLSKTAFSFVASSATTAAYRVLRQPISSDIISFLAPVVGAAPIDLPGENIYPTATAAFTGDDINGAITSGAVVRMDNTDLSAVIKVGDKITTPVTTDTVNGDFSSGATAITMDAAVATKMAVGDQVTGTTALDAGIFTVASIDSTNVFSLSASAAIDDGTALRFSSKINRSLTTVTVVETSSTATDFTMSQAIQFRDNAPLTFFNQMNYRWPVNNFVHTMRAGFIVTPGGNIVAGTTLAKYSDTTTVFAGTDQEKIYTNYEVEALDTLSLKPTITRGEVSTQAGAIVFNQQQPLAIAGESAKIGGYGQGEILRTYGYDVVFTDLAIALTPVTTTTTAPVSNSTSVVVASRNGILDDVSTVSGIGINAGLVDPTVDTGAGAVTGAGTLVLTAAQTLESGATLTFANAGLVATITGNIQVLKAGTASQTLRFDIDKLLSIT